uniref:Uncharacterized protein n=1 Tax=Tanacetum cinerariifolium TaxID=118510 RepID=A0A699RM97_TANCI|nr:hypothetical protein [Tanacetum cinerariifolium]
MVDTAGLKTRDKEVQISKRTVQEVDRQSTEEEKGKKSDDSNRPKQNLGDDIEKKELKAYLDIVSVDEFVMEVESLATEYPIIDWKTHVLAEHFMYYQIIRADRSLRITRFLVRCLMTLTDKMSWIYIDW